MAGSDFSAKRANKRQSPIDGSSSALPKLPASSSLVAVVPRTIVRSPRPQPGKFVFSDPKRVLQHYQADNGPKSDIAACRKSANSGNGKLRKQSRQAEYARPIAWQRLVTKGCATDQKKPPLQFGSG